MGIPKRANWKTLLTVFGFLGDASGFVVADEGAFGGGSEGTGGREAWRRERVGIRFLISLYLSLLQMGQGCFSYSTTLKQPQT